MKPQSVRIGLLTAEEIPDSIRESMETGSDTAHGNGMIYARAGSQFLCCEDSEAGEDLIRAMTANPDTGARPADPWQKALRGDTSAGTIRDHVPRCVIVFRASSGQDRLPGRALFEELIPTEKGDAITEINGEIVLIKQADGLNEEEIAEFTAAVTDTAETEAGIRLQAGIGRVARNISDLRDSFNKAETAICLGKRFHPGGSVYVFGHLAAERLINAVPPRERAQLRKELFTPETRKLMTGEMMETIDAFFRNDLNLSTTAREMFIHRNTLIYRLDKIRKVTGYDLRRFQDAAAFCLLSRLPENEE